MTSQIELQLELGANFSATITLPTAQAGRTQLAHMRANVGDVLVKLAFATGSGIALAGNVVTLTATADQTAALVLATDAARWYIDIVSIGATSADTRREAEGGVLVTRGVTRTSEATAAANASKLLTYSTDDGQTLTTPEKTAVLAKIGASGAVSSIVGITGTKGQFDTAVTDGNFLFVGDAPTAHTQALSTLTQSSATTGQVPTWSGTAWVPATPSGGSTVDTWSHGKGMFQDYAGTVPVTAAGQYCKSWRADTGALMVSKLLTDNTVHVAALFRGVLAPYSRPASNAHFETAASYAANAYEYSTLMAHNQPLRGLCICQDPPTSGIIAFDSSELRVTAPSYGLYGNVLSGHAIGSNVTHIAYKASSTEQLLWVNGQYVPPFAAPATTVAPIRIGRLTDSLAQYTQDGVFVLEFSISTGFDSQERVKIHQRHLGMMEDLPARKGLMLLGDSTSSLAGDFPFDPGLSLTYLLARKYRFYGVNVSGASFNNLGVPGAVNQEIVRQRLGPVDTVIWNTNDYGGGGGAAVAGLISAFVTAQKAAGYLARAFWCRTFTRPGANSAAFQADVDAAHAILSVDPNITVLDFRSLAISPDNVHPTEAGVRQAYAAIAAAIG